MANLRDVAQNVNARAAHKLARGAVTVPLPIFDGQYLARFGVLDAEHMSEFGRPGRTLAEKVEIAAEFVAEACRCILARPTGSGAPVKLTHDDGRPVRFDKDFAEALELEPAPDRDAIESMADVVLACWTVEEQDEDGEAQRVLNGTALDLFGARLLEWMEDTSRLVEGELVGESNGARP